jgi:protein TonB
MNWSLSSLFHLGAAHPETTGWGASLAVHVAGAAAIAWLGTVGVQSPAISGHRTAAQVQLVATTWTVPEPPAPLVVVEPSEPKVVVLPNEVRVADQTYRQSSTDVTEPTPEELAMVDRLLPAPREAVLRRSEEAAAAAAKPPVRQVARKTPPAVVPVGNPVVSAPREQSAGTTADTLPQLLDNRPPIYPNQAIAERLQGTVLLRIELTSEGTVGAIEVAAGSGHAILDAAAVQAVRSWRFQPAMRFGRPIPYTVRLPVRFSLD